MGEFTDELEQAITSSGSLVQDCDCGRTHFADGTWGDWEPGELETLRSKAETMPKNFIEHDGGSVHWGMFDGRIVVMGCECDLLEKIEKRLLRIESIAIAFYRLKAQTLRRQADVAADRINSVEG